MKPVITTDMAPIVEACRKIYADEVYMMTSGTNEYPPDHPKTTTKQHTPQEHPEHMKPVYMLAWEDPENPDPRSGLIGMGCVYNSNTDEWYFLGGNPESHEVIPNSIVKWWFEEVPIQETESSQ